ncbi:MAG: fructose-bisphosphate aldolase [Candidatus Sericytochromatia bacterium]|nr:MAG: fructose-bisphosphate aldolase [Candidatus Sericytochromatia bacterium]
MTLVSSKDLLIKARKENFAIPAFNVNNIEMGIAIKEAIEECKSPVILQVSQGNIKYIGFRFAVDLVKMIAKNTDMPVVLHLDHGNSFEQNIRCIQEGFTSLMFDGSKLPFEENIKITSKIVEIAHICNIPVEAELGKVLATEDNFNQDDVNNYMTNPQEALEFVNKTNVDSLAVAIGNIHRMKDKEVKLNIDILKEISNLVDIPLVLHGSSGVMIDSIKEGIKYGLAKINIATELNIAFRDGISEYINQNPNDSDVRKALSLGKQRVKEKVIFYLKEFDTINKA